MAKGRSSAESFSNSISCFPKSMFLVHTYFKTDSSFATFNINRQQLIRNRINQ